MTMRSGFTAARAPLDGSLRSGGAAFSRTKILSSRFSTRQHDKALNAGAPIASPVRKLKRAWCHGQWTVSPAIKPSASGPL
jgi:hypothetical protein